MSKMDYRFKFGKYDGMLEANDPSGEGYKILTLSNILNMRPGTLQDTPNCGLSMDNAQFAETGKELDTVISRIQADIMQLSNDYIEPGFVTSVDFKLADTHGAATDGSQDCSINITLRSGTVISIESTNTSTGLMHKSIKIDKTPFINTQIT